MSILYVIATPIGNLGDITIRALETLKKVDLVACEDTRQTAKLLQHYQISVPLISCRAQNELKVAPRVISILNEGKLCAYLSDAGTPGISDPGALLVRAVLEAGHEIIPLPGPSAFATLLSVAGGLDKTVTFEGFVSPKGGRRRTRLEELMERKEAFVLYESPFRIVKLLEDVADIDGERYVCVGREMTKYHEEYLRGRVTEVLEKLRQRGDQKGEFSVYISGKKDNKILQ
ncbi:MAG TPA: 16S rRNA (cytidine(1402)-2'-O)-methyltransferase [Termitinemataceae bacterium]|nr:16S rRNA (cytidine(1402)-2'-O)-methyltransferase [Termitinemataceae bacterium]HOM22198.1 16S rRNA (cytidine(1402)-2'-O)-methyltransferase [Termitinemataceae bacterium]HPP99380.1 16S rRNA (cytidine(1402)-2'-O)-methyltransferase [Termitinemataceae bacterium]